MVTQKDIPFSYREAYNSLRTNIKFIAANENVNSFVVTSAMQMESKSNVAANLAITLAEERKKVVLLDCDFRKPMIHCLLDVDIKGHGITDVLTGDCPLQEALYHHKDLMIDIMPVGTIPPNPTELLSTARMQRLINALKEAYDYVIIDTPPVSVVTDAAIVGEMVDGAFLVVRSAYAPLEMLQLAKEKLEDVDVKIFGIILSRFNVKRKGRESGYYYSYNDHYYSNDSEQKMSNDELVRQFQSFLLLTIF